MTPEELLGLLVTISRQSLTIKNLEAEVIKLRTESQAHHAEREEISGNNKMKEGMTVGPVTP